MPIACRGTDLNFKDASHVHVPSKQVNIKDYTAWAYQTEINATENKCNSSLECHCINIHSICASIY